MTKNAKTLTRIIAALVAFAVCLSLYLTMESRMPFWGWLIVFIAIYLVIGYDVLLRAVRNIAHGKVFDENFLMIVATVGAFAIGEYAEAVAVMLFYQVGEFFQNYAVGKSRRSIAELMDICPETATVLDGDAESVVTPEDVAVGSLVLVRPGEKIPIDGIVESGEAYLDCAALTGESRLVKVSTGDEAISGAIDTSAAITVRTSKPYADSTVSRILDLVENASSKKARAENFITRFAAVYTPAVVIAAVLLAVLPPLCIAYNDGAVWVDWVKRALTFLVVSCPCALVISVPMSFFGGIGAASKRGILVKGSNYLEILNRTDILVLDKTGTLTKGKFDVVNVTGERDRVLSAAYAAENGSLHPIARSIVRAAVAENCDLAAGFSVEEVAGKGVIARSEGREILCGNARLFADHGIAVTAPDDAFGTVVYVADGGEYIGSIEIADGVKDDSAAAISELKALGVKSVMLTGDRKETAARVADMVGVQSYIAELLPDQKLQKLEEIMQESGDTHGKTKHSKRGAVAFAGDGINDAPALSRADVGIAMGALGSDAAIEAADVVLMNDKLTDIVLAKRIAEKTCGIVVQNIVFALAVKAAVLILAAFGIANMWLAVFADVGVAVLAILNAMRALRVPKR